MSKRRSMQPKPAILSRLGCSNMAAAYVVRVLTFAALTAAAQAQTTSYATNIFITAPAQSLDGVKCPLVNAAVLGLMQISGYTTNGKTVPSTTPSSAIVCNPISLGNVAGASLVVRFVSSADANAFAAIVNSNVDRFVGAAMLPCSSQLAVSGFNSGQVRYFCQAPAVPGLAGTSLKSATSLCCNSGVGGGGSVVTPAETVPPPPPSPSPTPPAASNPPPNRSPPPPPKTPTGNLPSGTSALWGTNGELWRATGRLLDWSYAGYAAGSRPIPSVPQSVDVKANFGAKGDGSTDDTQAFLAAISKLESGAIYIPPGRYVLTQRLIIIKPNVVLRGAGMDATTLYFPKNLAMVYGNNPEPPYGTEYSYGPGFIHFLGEDPYGDLWGRDFGTPNTNENVITTVAANASRGDTMLAVKTTQGIKVNDMIMLALDGGMSQIQDFNAYLVSVYDACVDRLCTWDNRASNLYRFPSRVVAIDASRSTITLERPIPYNISMNWDRSIYVYKFAYAMSEVGIENVTVEFKLQAYPGHLKEQGWNGIFFEAAYNCWIKGVRVINADVGINFNRTHFCTVTDVETTTNGYRGAKGQGHHGIDVMRSSDVLVTRFNIRTPVLHDLSTEWFNVGVVYANGKGADINMDHHREQNYGTLWSNIDVGAGSRPFESSGNGNYRGLHAGALSTYWNIYSSSGARILLPDSDFGPMLNFVGVDSWPPKLDTNVYWRNWWLESMPRGTIQPADLFTAMVSTRTARFSRRALLQEPGQDEGLQTGQADEVHGPHPISAEALQWETHLQSRRVLAAESFKQSMKTWAQHQPLHHEDEQEEEEEDFHSTVLDAALTAHMHST